MFETVHGSRIGKYSVMGTRVLGLSDEIRFGDDVFMRFWVPNGETPNWKKKKKVCDTQQNELFFSLFAELVLWRNCGFAPNTKTTCYGDPTSEVGRGKNSNHKTKFEEQKSQWNQNYVFRSRIVIFLGCGVVR